MNKLYCNAQASNHPESTLSHMYVLLIILLARTILSILIQNKWKDTCSTSQNYKRQKLMCSLLNLSLSDFLAGVLSNLGLQVMNDQLRYSSIYYIWVLMA